MPLGSHPHPHGGKICFHQVLPFIFEHQTVCFFDNLGNEQRPLVTVKYKFSIFEDYLIKTSLCLWDEALAFTGSLVI